MTLKLFAFTELKMAIWNRDDNWLLGIGTSDHPNHAITNIGNLTPDMVNAAFSAMYGPGKFKARDHGTVITVWSDLGYGYHLATRAARMRELGNVERADELDARSKRFISGEEPLIRE